MNYKRNLNALFAALVSSKKDESQSTEIQENEDNTQSHPKVNLDAEFDQLYEKMTQTNNMDNKRNPKNPHCPREF